MKSDKLHALQKVKRSVYEKDQVEQQQTSKIVQNVELPKLARNCDTDQSLEENVAILGSEALDDFLNNANASEFSYAQVMENWLSGLSLSSGDDDVTDEEDSNGDDNDETNLLVLNRKIEEMKFDDDEACRATNPLPEENNWSYPQQRLTGFRAKKMLLQQLFDNLIKLPLAFLKHGSL